MKLKAMFFKDSGKYYSTNQIEIPNELISIKDCSERWYSVQKYIHENRSKFGFNDMIMFIADDGCDHDIIGYPIMEFPEMCENLEDFFIDQEYKNYCEGMLESTANWPQ